VQLFDAYRNNLIVGGGRFYMRLSGDASFLSRREDVVPTCQDTQNGRAVCTYEPVYRGQHQVTVMLLNHSVTQPGGLGLTGSYYTAADGATDSRHDATYVRIDKKVQFSWSSGLIVPSWDLAAGEAVPLSVAGQSVRWEGYLVAPRSDTFRIVAAAQHLNASVYIDEVLVFDSLAGVTQPVQLVLDAAYAIRVIASSSANTGASGADSADSAKDNGGAKWIDLRWSTATVREYTVPTFFLYDSAAPIVHSPFAVTVAAP
jgi:hypothetical protein